MAVVTLKYTIEQTGVQTLAKIKTKMENAPIFQGELAMLGMTVATDSTAIAASKVTRSIVLQTTTLGDSLFPTAQKLKDATRGLYKLALSGYVPASVKADEPLVA